MISGTHSIISLVTFVALFRLVITISYKQKLMILRMAKLAWKSKKANCRVQERGVEILHWRSRGTGQGRAGRAGQGRAGRVC